MSFMEGCAEFIFAEKLPHHCHSKSLKLFVHALYGYVKVQLF
jgi:hypothetical protein